MVLKKAKFSANTGNTFRRSPLSKLCLRKRPALIRKFGPDSGNKSSKSNRVYPDDGNLDARGFVEYSLNKKRRWQFPHDLKYTAQERQLKRAENLEITSKEVKQKKKRRKKDNGANAEKSSSVERIVMCENILHTNCGTFTCCQTVVDTVWENPVSEWTTWKGKYQKQTRSREEVDIFYEVQTVPCITGWPYYQKKSLLQKQTFKKSSRREHCLFKWEIKEGSVNIESLSCPSLKMGFDEEEMSTVLFDSDYDEKKDVLASSLVSCALSQDRNGSTHQSKRVKNRSCEQVSKAEFKQSNQCSSQLVKEYPKGSMIIETEPSRTILKSTSSSPKEIEGKESHSAPLIQVHSSFEPFLPQFQLAVKSSHISKPKLLSTFGDAYVEGQTFPRTFAICVGLCKPRGIVVTKSGVWCQYVVTVSLCDTKEANTHGEPRISVKIVPSDQIAVNSFRAAIESVNETEGVINFTEVMMQFISRCYESQKDHSNIRNQPRLVAITPTFEKYSKWVTGPANEKLLFVSLFQGQRKHRYEEGTVKDSSSFHFSNALNKECGICFEPISHGQAASLCSCQHVFCRECWDEYLSMQMQNFIPSIECPETKCKEEVDLIALVSLTTSHVVSKHLKNLMESRTQATLNLKWCPGCEAIVEVHPVKRNVRFTKDQVDDKQKAGIESLATVTLCDTPTVKCICGRQWCFLREEEPHWPASCDVYKKHKRKLAVKVGTLFDSRGYPYTTEINVKRCPWCKVFIEKSEGCDHMTCRCGRDFCWHCSRPWNNHGITRCNNFAATKITFSSLDVTDLTSTGLKMIKMALRYQSMGYKWKRLRNKLQNNRTSRTQVDNQGYDSKGFHHRRALLQVCMYADDTINFLLYLTMAQVEVKSCAHKRRIISFCSRLSYILQRLGYDVDESRLDYVKTAKLRRYVSLLQHGISYLRHFRFRMTPLE